MHKFYHMMLEAPGLDPTGTEVENALNQFDNWIRYSQNCWIIYTDRDASYLYGKLGSLARSAKGGHIFIVCLDIKNRQGWMPKSLWNWLRENQSASTPIIK
jgi:hypothetical protein